MTIPNQKTVGKTKGLVDRDIVAGRYATKAWELDTQESITRPKILTKKDLETFPHFVSGKRPIDVQQTSNGLLWTFVIGGSRSYTIPTISLTPVNSFCYLMPTENVKTT